MKKFVVGVVVVSTLAFSGLTAVAAQPMQRGSNDSAAENSVSAAAYDEAAAVEEYVSAQEARKTYLEDMYNRGLITKERYDRSIEAVQADIDYVIENGLSTPDPSNYSYYGNCGGYGGNGNGCCRRW